MSEHDKQVAVLIVEDDPGIGETLQAVLEEIHFTVECTRNASGALCSLSDHSPDLVLLDCHLPGGRMSEVLTKAGATGAAIVLMSGHSELLTQLAASGYPCLHKPFRLAELSTAVDNALRGRTGASSGAACH